MLLALALTGAGSLPARAAGKEKAAAPEDANAAQARLHYQKAASLYELGRYQEAIPEYEAAFQLKNDPAFLYNLAQCHRLAGNLEQALHFYRRYLVKDPKETKAALRADSESRITQLEKLIAEKNSVKTTPPNELSTPGGTGEPPPLGTTTPPPANTALPPPNTTATAPGTTTPPPVEMGQTPVLTAPAPPPGPPPTPGQGRTLKKAGIITLAVSGGLFLIGAIEGGRAVGAANEVNAAAKAGGTFDPAVESRGKTAQSVEVACIAISLVGAAVGGTLIIVGHKKEQAAASVGVTPVASADSFGALLRVTY